MCREDPYIERAQKRQDAIDAAMIDEFAAQPDRAHRASNLNVGVSPWKNARPSTGALRSLLESAAGSRAEIRAALA